MAASSKGTARDTVSLEDLLAELEQALAISPRPSGACTVAELAEAIGVSQQKVRHVLKRLLQQGKLGRIWVKQECLDGLWRAVPAYYLLAREAE